MRVPLVETVPVFLNGSGAGQTKVGPKSSREIWYPETVSVSANAQPTNEATCIIFVGDVNTKAFRDSTFTGSSGDSTDRVKGDVIKVGSYVWASWTGGDANVQAMLTVTGEKEI